MTRALSTPRLAANATRAVSAADAGPRPPCQCHGEPMWWQKMARVRAGGSWRCRHVGEASGRKWRSENRDRTAAYARRAREANPQLGRSRALRQRYGITVEDYRRLLTDQGGVCALCPATETDSAKGVLFVDHDHETGAIRGLLCVQCNTALERAEMPGWPARAAGYLESKR